MSNDSPSSGIPWFANSKNITVAVTQMGPVIAILFVFVYVIIKLLFGPVNQIPGKFSQSEGEHANIYYEARLTNHFMWAKCYNDTELIQDPVAREEARRRCQPPIEKVPDDKQSYLYTIPSFANSSSNADTYVASKQEKEGSQSGSSSASPPNPREAEAVAAKQAADHRAALKRAGNENVQVLSPSPL